MCLMGVPAELEGRPIFTFQLPVRECYRFAAAIFICPDKCINFAHLSNSFYRLPMISYYRRERTCRFLSLSLFILQQGKKVFACLQRTGSDMRLVEDIKDQSNGWKAIYWMLWVWKMPCGVDHVFHCAAMISYVAKNRDQLMQVNVEGTSNVVNVALDSNIKKLVNLIKLNRSFRQNRKRRWNGEWRNSWEKNLTWLFGE